MLDVNTKLNFLFHARHKISLFTYEKWSNSQQIYFICTHVHFETTPARKQLTHIRYTTDIPKQTVHKSCIEDYLPIASPLSIPPLNTVYKLNLAVIEAGNGILDEGLQFNYKPLFVSL